MPVILPGQTDIYALTDARLSCGRTLETVVSALLGAGVKIIQYREKHMKSGEMLEECRLMRRLTREAGACFIVDDHVDLAILAEADGVHIGHTALLEAACKKAKELGLPSVVWTFGEAPLNVLRGKSSLKYITGSSDKIRLLSAVGCDAVYFADFQQYRDCSPEDFVRRVLVRDFGAAVAVCGYDFHFAKNRSGNSETLANLMRSSGKESLIIPPVIKNSVIISSTLIREYITKGDIAAASELLGRRYSFVLPVQHGRHLGTKIGFPTINQRFPDYQLVPAYGVYACLCEIDGVYHPGVSNIGVKPTVTDEGIILCETHILRFSENMYDKEVRVLLFEKLRDEKKFSSLDELKAAVAEDVRHTVNYFQMKC